MGDRMGHQLRTVTPLPSMVGGRLLQRKCACASNAAGGECEACQKKKLQRKSFNSELDSQNHSGVPPIVHEVLRSPGQPLDASARAFMEPRFGHDFSQVRVHTDGRAAESAQAVNAHAYTVGDHVVFASGRYVPKAPMGMHLLAHELTHVVQQSSGAADLQSCGIVDENYATEREADLAAQTVIEGERAHVTMKSSGTQLQRHKDDIVAYGGGQSNALRVIQAGKLIYTAPAVSGHPGHGENELSVGPIPAGRYVIHPGITRPAVSKIQKGTCGAAGISSGFQEITSTDLGPCSGAHYCNVPCPTSENPKQLCFTPRDCWGPMRIKVEGTKAVVTPGGKKETRDGFFIHGGNRADAVSSGCAKTMDNGVLAEIRKLTGVKGAVPFCVGTGCPPSVDAAVFQATVEDVSQAVKSISDAVEKVFDPWKFGEQR